MNRKILLVLILIAAALAFVFTRRPAPSALIAALAPEGTKCYTRSVAATDTAPYSVQEDITLSFDGTAVSGTKTGTQSGPDMTNSYAGTLSGTRSGDALEVLFSYVIEGAPQTEQERYVLRGASLIKQRYPLIEKGKMLVPDTTQHFVEQPYQETGCPVPYGILHL